MHFQKRQGEVERIKGEEGMEAIQRQYLQIKLPKYFKFKYYGM